LLVAQNCFFQVAAISFSEVLQAFEMSSFDETSLKKWMSDHHLPSFYDRNVQKTKGQRDMLLPTLIYRYGKTLPKMATKIQVSMNQKQRKNPSILSCHHLVWLNCWDSRFLVCTQRSMDFVFHTSRKNRPVLSASNW